MLRTLLLATSFAAIAGSAVAADLPARVAAPAPYATPIFSWTGFYVGLNAGGAFSNSIGVRDINNYNQTNEVTSVGRKTSFTGGAQVGYNMQFGNFVVGGEADISALRADRSARVASSPIDSFVETKARYLGTVRGRLGFAFDRALIYATGGVAFSDVKTNYIDNCSTGGCGGGLINAGKSQTTGFALGGGLEYAVTNNWSLKAEYLHAHFKGGSFQAQNNFGGTYRFSAGATKIDIARVGVNYRF